ncbi:heme iron utilization protein [filamentous cyanobacterium CCP5]|nr:heme iron utilization protein [filamentous cyanobacterium CCP5]
MAEPITAAVSDRICKHMNDDHGEAVLMYAQIYGRQPEAIAAVMDSIDPEGMNLTATVGTATLPVRVPFDHTLEGAEDAHHTLVAMLKQSRSNA